LSEVRASYLAFVMNVGSLAAERMAIGPNYQLRRAADDERETIRATFLPLTLGSVFRDFAWERTLPAAIHGLSQPMLELPPREKRYFVIEYRGPDGDSIDPWYRLQQAFDISTGADLQFPMNFRVGDAPASGWSANRVNRLLNRCPPQLLDVGHQDVTLAAELHTKLGALTPADSLTRLLGQFGELKALDHSIRFLGYFGVLESMLTHKPQPSDPHSSISRQVRKKIALLNNRWQPALDYGAFGSIKPENVWTKMYSHRSLLAHGDRADFKSGDLRDLKGEEAAMSLIEKR
jgi:hypothetical protein